MVAGPRYRNRFIPAPVCGDGPQPWYEPHASWLLPSAHLPSTSSSLAPKCRAWTGFSKLQTCTHADLLTGQHLKITLSHHKVTLSHFFLRPSDTLIRTPRLVSSRRTILMLRPSLPLEPGDGRMFAEQRKRLRVVTDDVLQETRGKHGLGIGVDFAAGSESQTHANEQVQNALKRAYK